MSYTIFTSAGIVIGHNPRGEADRLIYLLTREHGLIAVTVKSARLVTSKLKFGTQFLSAGIYEYVRGKATYRLTGAHDTRQLGLGVSRDAMELLAQAMNLTQKFIYGEDPSPEFYDAVYDFAVWAGTNDVSVIALCDSWKITRLRLLMHLGYADAPLERLPTFDELTKDGLSAHQRQWCDMIYTRALEASHL